MHILSHRCIHIASLCNEVLMCPVFDYVSLVKMNGLLRVIWLFGSRSRRSICLEVNSGESSGTPAKQVCSFTGTRKHSHFRTHWLYLLHRSYWRPVLALIATGLNQYLHPNIQLKLPMARSLKTSSSDTIMIFILSTCCFSPKERLVLTMRLCKQMYVSTVWIIQVHTSTHTRAPTHTHTHTYRDSLTHVDTNSPGLAEEDYGRLLTQLQNPRVSHMNSLNLNLVCSLLGYALCQCHPDETGIIFSAWISQSHGILVIPWFACLKTNAQQLVMQCKLTKSHL